MMGFLGGYGWQMLGEWLVNQGLVVGTVSAFLVVGKWTTNDGLLVGFLANI